MSFIKVLITQDFNAPGGRSFAVDQRLEMDEIEAKEYERAGFLEILKKPAVKVVNKPRSTRKSVK